MSLKREFHSKWNVTQKGMSLKKECNSTWNVTQIEKDEDPKISKSASIGRNYCK